MSKQAVVRHGALGLDHDVEDGRGVALQIVGAHRHCGARTLHKCTVDTTDKGEFLTSDRLNHNSRSVNGRSGTVRLANKEIGLIVFPGNIIAGAIIVIFDIQFIEISKILQC